MALTTEDRLAILDLAARYNFAIDRGDAEAWASTFTPEGVFDSGRGPVTGRADLEGFAREFSQGRMRGTEHWNANHVIDGDGDGDHATHRCYLNLIRGESGESVARAKYRDDLTKVDGAWKFARRVVG